jgi:hypothetical protein
MLDYVEKRQKEHAKLNLEGILQLHYEECVVENTTVDCYCKTLIKNQERHKNDPSIDTIWY